MKKLLLIIAALFVSFNTFGQTPTLNGIIYDLDGNHAYIIGHEAGFNPTELTIPETITYQNKTYKIVEIVGSSTGTFSDCTNLTTLEIQSSITIGRRAFNNGRLVKVTCKSTTPPTIGSNTFGTNSDLKIHVPIGYVNAYKTADSWIYNNYAQYIQGEDPIVFVGSSSNTTNYWDTKEFWQGLPNGEIALADFLADKDVIIRAAAVIPSYYEAEVNKLTIDEENGGSITIREGGQLIVHAECTGEVTMEKNIAKYSANADNTLVNGWYSISSPFGNFTLSSNNFLTGNYELFRYNEISSIWENKKDNSNVNFDNLTLGKGYLYANEADQTISITGEINIDNINIELTAQSNDENLKGFNLIGNPFMHDITQNNVRGKDGEDLTGILSGGFYKLSNHGAWTACTDGKIKPLEGFLVRTLKDYTIKISHSHVSSSKRSNKGSITVNVSSKEYSDVAHISFNEGIGLNKIEHRNNEIPMVYIPVDGTDYAVAFMDENVEEIPVNFEAKKMGEYTISVSAEGRKYNRLTLLDKENNKEINMLAGSYTFLATVNDNPARFILKASLNNNQEAAFYTENNSIIIDNMKGAATVHVYDVMGRPVMKYNTNDSNCQLSTSSLANGVYIIQLMDENGTQVQKVIVNN